MEVTRVCGQKYRPVAIASSITCSWSCSDTLHSTGLIETITFVSELFVY